MRALDLPFHLIIPLACAVLYVVAALMLKRASALGVGVWRIGFLANWVMILFFLPVLFIVILGPAAIKIMALQ